jgi:hypothetical protein
MIFELPYSVYEQYNRYAGNGQSALLQAVKTSIAKTYSTTSIRADGQVALVSFDDGITFEIVPVFINQANSYTYPDANDGGSWRATNPRPEIEAIRSRNTACNGNLIPLCRMMRSWKQKWDVPIGGLLVDTLAYQFIENYQYRDKSFFYYDYMCRDFFKWMADLVETGTNIAFEYPRSAVMLGKRIVTLAYSIGAGALFAKPIRVRVCCCLCDRIQSEQVESLHCPVFHRRDTQRATFAIRLGNVYPY